MSIGITVVELREFKENKKKNNNMDKMGKIVLALIGRGSSILVKYFIHSFFDMFYALKSSEVELTVKLKTRTEFL